MLSSFAGSGIIVGLFRQQLKFFDGSSDLWQDVRAVLQYQVLAKIGMFLDVLGYRRNDHKQAFQDLGRRMILTK